MRSHGRFLLLIPLTAIILLTQQSFITPRTEINIEPEQKYLGHCFESAKKLKCLKDYFNHSVRLKKSDLELRKLHNGDELYVVPCGNFVEDVEYIGDDSFEFEDVIRGKSCAVMGTSGILLGSGFAEDVDAHDVVFRFGEGAFQTWQDGPYMNDTGNKTTVQVVNPSHIKQHYSKLYLGGDKYITGDYFIYNNLDCVKNTGHSIKLSKRLREKNETEFFLKSYMWNVEALRLLDDVFGTVGEKMTSGLSYLLLALTYCDSVDHYGAWPFALDCDNEYVRYHYWESGTISTHSGFHRNVHNFTKEYQLLQRLDEIFPHFTLRIPERGQCVKTPEHFARLTHITKNLDEDDYDDPGPFYTPHKFIPNKNKLNPNNQH